MKSAQPIEPREETCEALFCLVIWAFTPLRTTVAALFTRQQNKQGRAPLVRGSAHENGSGKCLVQVSSMSASRLSAKIESSSASHQESVSDAAETLNRIQGGTAESARMRRVRPAAAIVVPQVSSTFRTTVVMSSSWSWPRENSQTAR